MDMVRRLKSVYFYWTPDAQRGLVTEPVSLPSGKGVANSGNSSHIPNRGAASSFTGSSNNTTTLAEAAQKISTAAASKTILDNRRHIGFLAQDVQKVVPEAVSEMHRDRYLGVDYAALVPVLVGALQELDATVTKQGLAIAALQSAKLAESTRNAARLENIDGIDQLSSDGELISKLLRRLDRLEKLDKFSPLLSA